MVAAVALEVPGLPLPPTAAEPGANPVLTAGFAVCLALEQGGLPSVGPLEAVAEEAVPAAPPAGPPRPGASHPIVARRHVVVEEDTDAVPVPEATASPASVSAEVAGALATLALAAVSVPPPALPITPMPAAMPVVAAVTTSVPLAADAVETAGSRLLPSAPVRDAADRQRPGVEVGSDGEAPATVPESAARRQFSLPPAAVAGSEGEAPGPASAPVRVLGRERPGETGPVPRSQPSSPGPGAPATPPPTRVSDTAVRPTPDVAAAGTVPRRAPVNLVQPPPTMVAAGRDARGATSPPVATATGPEARAALGDASPTQPPVDSTKTRPVLPQNTTPARAESAPVEAIPRPVRDTEPPTLGAPVAIEAPPTSARTAKEAPAAKPALAVAPSVPSRQPQVTSGAPPEAAENPAAGNRLALRPALSTEVTREPDAPARRPTMPSSTGQPDAVAPEAAPQATPAASTSPAQRGRLPAGAAPVPPSARGWPAETPSVPPPVSAVEPLVELQTPVPVADEGPVPSTEVAVAPPPRRASSATVAPGPRAPLEAVSEPDQVRLVVAQIPQSAPSSFAGGEWLPGRPDEMVAAVNVSGAQPAEPLPVASPGAPAPAAATPAQPLPPPIHGEHQQQPVTVSRVVPTSPAAPEDLTPAAPATSEAPDVTADPAVTAALLAPEPAPVRSPDRRVANPVATNAAGAPAAVTPERWLTPARPRVATRPTFLVATAPGPPRDARPGAAAPPATGRPVRPARSDDEAPPLTLPIAPQARSAAPEPGPPPAMRGPQEVPRASVAAAAEPVLATVRELQVTVPDDRGEPLTVTVRDHDGRRVAASVVVEGPQAQQAVRQVEPQVRATLQGEGVQVSGFDVSARDQGARSALPEPPSPAARWRAESVPSRPQTPPASADRGQAIIDLYA